MEKPLTITELAGLLNSTLETAFPSVAFEGEVAEVSRPQSGHLYFQLKDGASQISAVMWSSRATRIPFQLKTGISVVCRGKPNVYPRSGRLQIIVDSIRESGEGLLQKKFLELKACLEKEGLFDPARKRALPVFPKSVGIVTSISGAAIHDMQVKLRERMPQIEIVLAPARVQGEGASQEIASAIQALNDFGRVDVIIVGRGGGSLEDLWAFNEEAVVRAVFASRIPIVSAVGHEVDVALSDFAADARAPTPTAAAEMVVPSRRQLVEAIASLERRFIDYNRWLMPLIQSVDELGVRLARRAAARVEQARLRLDLAQTALRAIEPSRLLSSLQERLDWKLKRVKQAVNAELAVKRNAVEALAGRLEALSPQRVLARGFSLVEHEQHIVRNALDLHPGDKLRIRFAAGSVFAIVEDREGEG